MAIRSNRWFVSAAALGAAGALFAVYAFDPATASFFPRCMFHQLTGLQCPGCGGTRALHALLHGNVIEALRFNAFLVMTGPFVALGAASEVVGRSEMLRRPWIGWTAALALIAWGVVRNLV
ncbi:MAG TPA: DUF2752 domain-containing protein [Thermoanaerobaculia bacterium]|nr:DUF2752 domain-containing protein [Thermoanaerobaculia bacterium]